MKYSSYKARNTLVLLTFLIVILIVGGYFILLSYPKKIHRAESQLKSIQQQIAVFDGVEIQFAKIQRQIKEEQNKLSNLNKQITAEVSPANTYSYLNMILKYSGVVKFDLLFAGSNSGTKYGYNVYNIKGEGSFNNIYRFIWYIERGPQIYRVKKLSLRGVESKDPETEETKLIVPFEAEIWALYADIKDLPKIKRKLSDVAVSNVRNPFYPYIMRDVPPNKNELVEVERAELKGVMPGKAFVADHNGNVHVLKEGDEVYLGNVTKIDTKKNQVVFTLNKAGIVEKFVLTLRFEQAQKER
ncbi:MAG: hypothetical protein ACE5KE_14130 [Methanosarcinales archaeon]